MTKSIGAAFIAIVEFSRAARDEFDEWFDADDARRAVDLPGVVASERWLAADGTAKALMLHHLSDLRALQQSGGDAVAGERDSLWLRRMPARCECMTYEANVMTHAEKPGVELALGLLLVGVNVTAVEEPQFNAWYDEEHIPRIFALPGVLGARRYRSARGAQRYLVIYHLAAPEVQASSAWAEAINTPWASDVRPHTLNRVRLVCRRYGAAS